MTVTYRGPRRVPGLLFAYHRPSLGLISNASNVEQNVAALTRHSRFPVHAVNTDLPTQPALDRLRFDAVALHYTVFVNSPDGYLLDARLREHLAATDAYKVAFFQDEYHWCARRAAFIDEHRIDCIYTMLEPPYADRVYGDTRASRIVTHLPSYVGPELTEAAAHFAKPDAERSIEVGYRGRPSPPYWGRGAQEKYEIGARFAERAAGSGLRLDISAREQDRLYGKEWHRFMGDCKATLGVESGVSCFDLRDEVRLEYEALRAAGEEPTIERLEQGALGRWDWKIPYRTISPRNFEAAAFRTTQLLYEGHYSGALEPMRHYIPLHKDLSNFEQAIERFRDPDLRRELTDNAYTELIASGEWSYERFIEGFDRVLEEAGVGYHGAAVVGGDRLLRAPLLARAARKAHLLWVWLRAEHPRAWRALHLASRPVVFPVRLLQRALGNAQ